ncbi:hypothetical protein D3C73_939480 [compost metagenome]
MGQGIGSDRVAEGLAFKRRRLAKHFFPPQGAQLRLACRRSVAVQILGTVSGELILNNAEVHRYTVFGGNPDGCVVFLGVSSRFGGLAQNALLGIIQRFAQIGEHIVHMFIACLDAVIQLSSQWIHQFHPSGILLGYTLTLPNIISPGYSAVTGERRFLLNLLEKLLRFLPHLNLGCIFPDPGSSRRSIPAASRTAK